MNKKHLMSEFYMEKRLIELAKFVKFVGLD
jgi:hypothetical protein